MFQKPVYIWCQFLIGKVKLYSADMRPLKSKIRECQFLIGKVKQSVDKVVSDLKNTTCQFLIGKVKLKTIEDGTKYPVLCQFLIGKVKQLYFQSL